MYFQNWTNKAGKVSMHPGSFVGFSCNVSDTMTFKVIQCNTDLHNHNMVLYIGVIILYNLGAKGFNSSLAPKSDAYFPEVHLEGGTPIIPSTRGHQGPCIPLILS